MEQPERVACIRQKDHCARNIKYRASFYSFKSVKVAIDNTRLGATTTPFLHIIGDGFFVVIITKGSKVTDSV